MTPPTPDQPWNTGRFVDALVGGGIGLAVSALLMPVDPARHARAATDPVIATLADGYRRVGEALTARDSAAAEAALADLRDTAPVLATFHAGLDATRESVRLAPWYWGQRTVLADYALAGVHLDIALRNLRVLARQATLLLDRGEAVPRSIPAALADLSRAAAALGPALAGETEAADVRAALLSAVAHTASTAAEADPRHGAGLFDAPLVAQVRLSAADLLQATGMSADEAHTAIRAHGDTRRT